MPGRLNLLARLVVKDWRLFLADRRAAVLCFAMPIVLAVGFGAVFDRAGAKLDAVRLPLIIVDEDDSTLTRDVVADLLASPRVEGTVAGRAEAQRTIERQGSGVAVVLPNGIGRALERRESAPAISLLHHPLSGVESQWAEGIVTEIVMRRLARAWLPNLPGLDPARVLERPFDVTRGPIATGGVLDSYSHSFCGMTLQYLLFWGMESGLLLLRERQRGLWARLLTAPVGLPMIVTAKFLSTAGIALALVLVTFGVGWSAFGVKLAGSAVGFALMAAAAAMLAAAAGLLVATLGGTEARARSLCILVILAVSLLGGLWLPLFLLPGWAQDAARTLPTNWAVRGLDGVTWQGMGCGDAAWCAAVVTAFGFVFLGIAALRFTRLESRRRLGLSCEA